MDLIVEARSAGAAGQSWTEWVMSDEIQDAIATATSMTHNEQAAIEKAFAEGRREWGTARGRIVWTTAPSDYDGADATELEVVGDYFGKPLRKIAINPEGYQWQADRYASGTYGVWDQDPIEEDRRAHEKHARHQAEMRAVDAKHAAGVEWLRTATAAELADEDLCWERGARFQDVRAEKVRRHESAQEEERVAGMAQLVALIPDGATFIDEGEYIIPTLSGLRPIHRPAAIYYNVRLVHGWPDTVERATIAYDGARGADMPAERFADLIVKGKLRRAKDGEVPPFAVANRIGIDRWKSIRRIEVAGRVVWVGHAAFGSEDLILDDAGKLVRAKKVVEAARAKARELNNATLSAPTSIASNDDASSGHAWAPRRSKSRRSLRKRYGRGGWFGEHQRHVLAARKGRRSRRS